VDDGPVDLLDAAGGEELALAGEGLAVAAEDEAAAGVAVEAVGEAGAAGEAEAERVEVVLQVRAALRAGVDGQAGGLVDHEHHRVAVEQAA
jgi:hypothetical protein